MSKAFVFGFAVGIVFLSLVVVGASRRHQKDAEEKRDQAEAAEYQAELRDATPVQLGLLTENQRIHSRLYGHYLQLGNNRTIGGLVAQAKGKSRIVETGVFVGMTEALNEPETPEDYFGELAQSSDAVIRGSVTKRVSQITEDEGFIFTDYEVIVSEVLKNNGNAPTDIGKSITVTRPGGKVLLDGIIVKARDEAFTPLPVNNHEVVLFLKSIPETGAYRATRPTGAFELDGPILRPLTGANFPPGVLRDRDSFLRSARAVSKK